MRKRNKTVEETHLGLEPEPVAVETEAVTVEALNWYNYFNDSAKAKRYVINANKEKAGKISKIPDYELRTLGWIYRMNERGFIIPDKMEKANTKLADLITTYASPAKKEKKAVVKKPNVQSFIKQKTEKIICDLEEEVDKYILNPEYKFDPYPWMLAQDVSSPIAKKIMDHYEKWAQEDKFVKAIYDAAATIGANMKIVRKRKKKAPNVSNLIKNFKYKKEDVALKLQGLSPADIIGAKEVWTYDTDKRVLVAFRSVDGMTVKGTTIYGFDEAQSVTKRIRKPEVTIPEVVQASKAGMKKIMKALTTKEIKTTGRTNENTIIMRAFK